MKIYGLIGYPLEHSYSRLYFEKKFEALGLYEFKFNNYPISNIKDFPALLRQVPGLKGLSVTSPYKETVIPYLHRLDKEAARINAVNCIKVMPGGELIGYNTDLYGFSQSVKPMLNGEHTSALILGTGGAARAAHTVLSDLGLRVKYVSRKSRGEVLSYDDISGELLKHFTLILNCTPLGTFPEVHTCPAIPYDMLGPHHFLYDMVYNPESTEFMKRGQAQGARVMNGLSMLQLQAERSWAIWNSDEQDF